MKTKYYIAVLSVAALFMSGCIYNVFMVRKEKKPIPKTGGTIALPIVPAETPTAAHPPSPEAKPATAETPSAKERGITVTETKTAEADRYISLITVRVITTEMENAVSGTIFGKDDPRIVGINTFRLEMVPDGHLALIYNIDKPGSIGQIGTTLGKHKINIGRMQVGQEEEGDRNIIFITTDTPIPARVFEELRNLSLVKTVIPLEF